MSLSRQEGLSRKSFVMLEQIRTIDRARLVRYVGSLDEYSMKSVDAALVVSLGL